MLKQEGKGVVTHKPAISAEDMDKIQDSLDLDVGLQEKVFIENLREMALDSFDICEELGGKCYILRSRLYSLTLKDPLRRKKTCR